MKQKWNRRSIWITKVVLDFMMGSGVLVLLASPFLLREAGDKWIPVIQKHYLLYVLVYLLSGICGLYIVYQLRKMMKSVIRKECFIDENVEALGKMGRASLIITIAFFVKAVLAWTPTGTIIAFVFFIAALFCFVLEYVFAEAVRYKKENDLTI